MRPETTRLLHSMLFLQGHVADARLGADLVAEDAAAQSPGPSSEDSSMNLFKSFWLLGGLESIDPRIDDEQAQPFGATYGNRLASERAFGPARKERTDDNVKRARIQASDQRVAHC